jgi:S1-C subfamily serine protease
MVNDELKKLIHPEIKKAIVKIFVRDEFKGTGFFITQDGYLLTAYHCLGLLPAEIVIETNFGDKFEAKLDDGNSVIKNDIAVLKVDCTTNHCLPLGILSKEAHVSDEVVAFGYPAAHKNENYQIGTYSDKISRFRKDNKIEIPNALKGQGQSGGPVYHYATRCIVALTTE